MNEAGSHGIAMKEDVGTTVEVNGLFPPKLLKHLSISIFKIIYSQFTRNLTNTKFSISFTKCHGTY